jgi:hypothetical protein
MSGATLDANVAVSSVVRSQAAATLTLTALPGTVAKFSEKDTDASNENRESDQHERHGVRVAAGIADVERQVARHDGQGSHR